MENSSSKSNVIHFDKDLSILYYIMLCYTIMFLGNYQYFDVKLGLKREENFSTKSLVLCSIFDIQMSDT